MARIRTIKPDTWTDTKFVKLSPYARLLFIGSWNYADDSGCVSADAMQLKLRVLPADSVNADELVQELLDLDLFRLMEDAEGERFWLITGFVKHQKVDRRTKSSYGDPDTWKRVSTRRVPPTPPESSTSPAESRRTHATEGRKEEEGREGKEGKESSALALRDERPDVERLCLLLADKIEANGSKRPDITGEWRDSARRMLDLDGRTEEHAAWLIDWCQRDDFWHRNILSMPKFRKQYDQLRLKAQSPQTSATRSGDDDGYWERAHMRALEHERNAS